MGVTKIEAYHGQSLANSARSLVTAFLTIRSTNRMFLPAPSLVRITSVFPQGTSGTGEWLFPVPVPLAGSRAARVCRLRQFVGRSSRPSVQTGARNAYFSKAAG